VLLRTGSNTFSNASGFCRITFAGDELDIHERQFGWRDAFVRLKDGDDRGALGGMAFCNADLRSTITFSPDGAALTITGPAGESDTYAVRTMGKGFLAFDCDRALDETPPGRFTIRVSDVPRTVVVGCFLARDLVFSR
jgi:D-aminopeptidase, domain B